jgi:hypothetical protein
MQERKKVAPRARFELATLRFPAEYREREGDTPSAPVYQRTPEMATGEINENGRE